jgi:hypothetical protein
MKQAQQDQAAMMSSTQRLRRSGRPARFPSTRAVRHGDTKPAIRMFNSPDPRAGSLLSITSQRNARSPKGHRWQRCKGTDAWISSGCSITGIN